MVCNAEESMVQLVYELSIIMLNSKLILAAFASDFELTPEVTVITCPNCGRENQEKDKLCMYCGEVLIDLARESASTRTLEDTDFEENVPKWGSARFTSRIHLIINYNGDDHYVTIETADMHQLIVGREDPNTGQRPPIDLTDLGAQDKGVSRQHAALLRKDGSLHIVDKGSPNGTYLNGQRLVTDQPRVLRDGDDIRLAHLVMRVQFERT